LHRIHVPIVASRADGPRRALAYDAGMLEQRIQQHFFDGADLKYQSAETLARPVAQAAEALLAALTGGGKILVCGTGSGIALAQLMARLLIGRFERERPPLAALALGSDAAQQVRALGLPGDVLLYIDDPDSQSTAVVAAAQGKDMTLVVLAGRGASAFNEWLGETDVLVPLPHERTPRIVELQLLVLHCLCDAVDYQLMGELET
jgi:D-sedoheptulose 7-phosphate isomerase